MKSLVEKKPEKTLKKTEDKITKIKPSKLGASNVFLEPIETSALLYEIRLLRKQNGLKQSEVEISFKGLINHCARTTPFTLWLLS